MVARPVFINVKSGCETSLAGPILPEETGKPSKPSPGKLPVTAGKQSKP
jgi:hypothetical protein